MLLHGIRNRGTDCSRCRAQGVEDGRTSNCDRCLLVAWKVSDWWLVKASSRINVNGVDDFICTFGALRTNGGLVLARWRKE